MMMMTNRPKLPDGPVFCAGPFYVQEDTGWICGTDAFGGLCHVADIRGWGYLTGRGQALALSADTAIEAQIRTAKFIVDAMNEKVIRDAARKEPSSELLPSSFYMWGASENCMTAGYWSYDPPTGGGNPTTRFVALVPIDAPTPEALSASPEVQALVPEDQWQPIETAPKDGTAVLVSVWELGPDMASAAWNGAFWDMGYLDEVEYNGDRQFYSPTHWMPLPAPPAAIRAASEAKP